MPIASDETRRSESWNAKKIRRDMERLAEKLDIKGGVMANMPPCDLLDDMEKEAIAVVCQKL